jgi:hypothetical protein
MDNEKIQVINLAEYKAPIINESTREDWVEYGEDNNYFQFLIDRHINSATNNAVINNITRLIYGKGLTALDANKKPNEFAQLITLISSDDLRKISVEAYLLGQCAIQVHYDKGHTKILKAYHIPVQLLRAEKCNEDGEITGYYYSDNWEDVKKYKPKRLDAFGFGKSEIEILYVKPYSVGMKYYSNVTYTGGLPYTIMEEEIAEYLINDVQNGFSPTMIVNFVGGTGTEEQRRQIEAQANKKLTGSKGKKIVYSFNKNKDNATTVESIPLNDAPAHYQYLSEECMRKILLSHNVTSPLLFGIATTTGFSSNADELKNSLLIFDNLVIKPYQNLIIDAIDKILAVNGISLKLYFEGLNPFEDMFAKKEEAIAQDTTLSEHKSKLEVYLDSIGEVIDEKEWVIVDERDVNLNEEEILDRQIELLNNPKKNFLQKLASAVKAIPNAKSEQDATIKGVNYKVRYKYYGNPNPDRDFCKVMMRANKLYRKEDLENVNSNLVNPGFGHNDEPYNVFLFAGGPRCKHFFRRVTFMSTNGIDVNSPNAETISTETASKRGYRVTNPYQVGVQKNNLPLKGFHPDNKNLPSDVK